VNFWWWFLLFGGIAVAALGLFVLVGLQLWRKAKVLVAELARLSALAGTLETAMAAARPGDEPTWSPEPLSIRSHRSE